MRNGLGDQPAVIGGALELLCTSTVDGVFQFAGSSASLAAVLAQPPRGSYRAVRQCGRTQRNHDEGGPTQAKELVGVLGPALALLRSWRMVALAGSSVQQSGISITSISIA